MAEQADGSIIVDTKIATEGFKADSAELKRAIKSLNTKVENLGPTLQKALSGSASALSTFDSKAAALENTISELETRLENLGEKRKVPTEDYQWLTTEIKKAKNELSKLEEKQIKMEDLGVKKSSKSWQSLQYDIDLAKRKIADYEAEQATMRDAGTAFLMGSNTAEYAQLESALSSARDRLAEMQAQAESTRGSTSRLAAAGNAIRNAFSKIGSIGKKAFSTFTGAVKAGASKLKQFKKSSTGAMGAINKLGKKITGFAGMLKRMALRKLMMAMITSVKEGFNNLAQYSNQTNADLSKLKSGLTQLKNSFATAFAPILTAVTPILATLINYLSSALTYIGKLFAALTGAKTFTKATAVQEDYAASLGETGKAADEAKRQLAGFDDLNVLSDSSSKDSGGSAGGASPSEMFEEVPIEFSITDFVGKIKDAFKKGDYASIGEIIGTKINDAVQKVNDFIKWDNVGSKVTKAVSGVAEGFNALTHTINWALIGDTLAQGFNTALNTLFLIITKFDWPGLAAGLMQGLNGLVKGIDWALLGRTLSDGFKTWQTVLITAVTTFDWAALGKGIADGINSIDWVGILSNCATMASSILKGALDLLLGFAYNLKWDKLGSDLWNGLVGIVTNIDWGGLISKAFELLGAALAGAVKLIVGFAQSLWESLKNAFNSTKEYFAKYIDEAGGHVIMGLRNGIWNGIKNIGTWIKEHIFDPFINGFKKVFGIHSPSTVMAEMGGMLIEGLLNGIKNLWSGITSFFSNALSGLKSLIFNAWDSIKTTASNAWDGIKGAISGAWNGIKSVASKGWDAVKTGVSTAWDSIKTSASQKWDSIKSTLSGAWEGLKTSASQKWNSLKTTISTAWDNIKTTASQKWDGIKNTLSGAWDNIKTAASQKINGLKTAIQDGWSGIKDKASTWGEDICSNLANGIERAKSAVGNAVQSVAGKIKSFLGFSEPEDGPLSDFHTYMPDMLELMASGIKNNQGKALGAVSGLASAISSEIQNGDYSLKKANIGAGLDGTLDSFSDKIVDGFDRLIDRLHAIADGVTFATPAIATSGIVPYSVSAGVAGAASGNIGGVIESSNDELASVVTQVVTNATAAIVRAIQDYSGTTVNLDIDSITDGVIAEINRKSRMMSKNPLLI